MFYNLDLNIRVLWIKDYSTYTRPLPKARSASLAPTVPKSSWQDPPCRRGARRIPFHLPPAASFGVTGFSMSYATVGRPRRHPLLCLRAVPAHVKQPQAHAVVPVGAEPSNELSR